MFFIRGEGGGLDLFFIRDTILSFYLHIYNTKRTIEFILSWIFFFSRKLGPGIFSPPYKKEMVTPLVVHKPDRCIFIKLEKILMEVLES